MLLEEEPEPHAPDALATQPEPQHTRSLNPVLRNILLVLAAVESDAAPGTGPANRIALSRHPRKRPRCQGCETRGGRGADR